MRFNIFAPKHVHTQEFRKAVVPYDFPCTPDIFRIQQSDYHYVFDWARIVENAHCSFREAYSIPKYYMYQCVHEQNTPMIVFNQQIDPRYITMPARLRGMLRLVSASEMVQVDIAQQNGIHCIRKQIRVIIPRFCVDDRTRRYHHIEPVTALAWIYTDNINQWKDKFDFDHKIWRPRAGQGGYRPMTTKDTWLDSRNYVGRFYLPNAMQQIKPKFGSTIKNRNDLLVRIRQEEDFHENNLKDASDFQDHPATRKLPQVS